jgi:hypothetical protein
MYTNQKLSKREQHHSLLGISKFIIKTMVLLKYSKLSRTSLLAQNQTIQRGKSSVEIRISKEINIPGQFPVITAFRERAQRVCLILQ